MLKFHHQMVVVKDMDEAIHLFVDVLGFELIFRGVVPNEVGLDNVEHFPAPIISEIATLDSNAGALIELGHFIKPKLNVANPEWVDYYTTGLKELGFWVENIHAWYKKIIDAGYHAQSEPWQAGSENCWTFVFYTTEGVIIQLFEDLRKPEVASWERLIEDPAYRDLRTPEQKKMLEESYKS